MSTRARATRWGTRKAEVLECRRTALRTAGASLDSGNEEARSLGRPRPGVAGDRRDDCGGLGRRGRLASPRRRGRSRKDHACRSRSGGGRRRGLVRGRLATRLCALWADHRRAPFIPASLSRRARRDGPADVAARRASPGAWARRGGTRPRSALRGHPARLRDPRRRRRDRRLLGRPPVGRCGDPRAAGVARRGGGGVAAALARRLPER